MAKKPAAIPPDDPPFKHPPPQILAVHPISEDPVLERPVKVSVAQPDGSFKEVDAIERYPNPEYHRTGGVPEGAARYDFGTHFVDSKYGAPTREQLDEHLKTARR